MANNCMGWKDCAVDKLMQDHQSQSQEEATTGQTPNHLGDSRVLRCNDHTVLFLCLCGHPPVARHSGMLWVGPGRVMLTTMGHRTYNGQDHLLSYCSSPEQYSVAWRFAEPVETAQKEVREVAKVGCGGKRNLDEVTEELRVSNTWAQCQDQKR